MKQPKKIVSIVTGSIVVVVVCVSVQQLVSKKTSIDKTLMEIAGEINKSCPVMLDAETRLDNTIALPNKTFQYNYTLVNLDRESIDTLKAKSILEPHIINDLKTNPQMQFQREHKIAVNYYYRDKNGFYVCAILIKPEQY